MGNQCIDAKSRQRNSRNIQLRLAVETWNKEAHNLFDHSTDKMKKQQSIDLYTSGLQLTDAALLVKHESNLYALSNLEDYHKLKSGRVDILIDVWRSQTEFLILKEPLNDKGLSMRNLWRVVGKTPHQLDVGDIFKLGRLRFEIKELILENAQIKKEEVIGNEVEHPSGCKVCYEKVSSTENPLISPCGCTGSIELIHLECLRQWLEKSGEVKKTQNCICIPSTLQNCQLCHEPIKPQITYNNKKYQTYFRPIRMEAPYVKLMLLSKDSNQQKCTCYYSFSKKSSTFIGRSSSAGIRVTDDISISRQHSELSFHDGKLLLSQYKSKFGTLLLVRNPIRLRDSVISQLDLNMGRKFQICNHVLTVGLLQGQRQLSQLDLKRSQQDVQAMLLIKNKEIVSESSSESHESIIQFQIDS